MRKFFANLQANPWLVKRMIVVALLIAACGGGFWWGRKHATGKTTGIGIDPLTGLPSNHGGRVVAWLYGDKVPVGREEFGEYLIARFGQERLEFMVNRKIVEVECGKKGISATELEIEDRLQQDLLAYGGTNGPLPLRDFENSVLKRWGKTLYEWREDVIRPKIMMEKMVRSSVIVGPKDLQDGFEARFGPKVECRMIILDGRDMSVAQKVWDQAKKGRAEFLEQARKQFIPQLAKDEGKVPAIHKHLGDKDLEDAAFRMQPGEISNLMKMNDGTCVILLCEKRLPADQSVSFETVRAKLHKEVTDIRVAQKLPEVFKEMRDRANPRLVLDNRGPLSSDILPASFSKEQTPVAPGPIQPPEGAYVAPLPNSPPPAPKIPSPDAKK